jgi:fructokinase
MAELVGSLEAGGTKFVCAVGTGPNDIRAEKRFATTTPKETLKQTIAFFRAQQETYPTLAAIGIGCFGPLDLKTGRISSTPKTAWVDTDVEHPIADALGLPVAFDTDVNVAALGEWRWGAAQGLDTFIYLTIGTGIGGGGMAAGRLLHGLGHPEMGHIKVPHDRNRDPFEGTCAFHGDCWEGLACGPALEKRWGRPAAELEADHPAWDLQADYLAAGLADLVCVLSPQRIIMGGGVMHQTHLFAKIRKKLAVKLNGYIRASQILDCSDDYVVPPALKDRAGICGGFALAQNHIAACRK